MDTPTGLTSEQLKTMRNATSLVIRSYWRPSDHMPEDLTLPCTFIEAIKEVDPGDGFGRRELPRVQIPVEMATTRNYSEGFGPVLNASWVSLFLNWDQPIGTLVRGILRPGDRVRPIFLIGNDSDNLRNAHLTQDELHIEVERGPVDQPRKVKRLHFEIDTAVYPPGSLARNVRFGPRESTYSLNVS
jgi:hypothetical protein